MTIELSVGNVLLIVFLCMLANTVVNFIGQLLYRLGNEIYKAFSKRIDGLADAVSTIITGKKTSTRKSDKPVIGFTDRAK